MDDLYFVCERSKEIYKYPLIVSGGADGPIKLDER